MGAHDFKLNKVPFSALKSVNINVSLSAAPKLALVPARCLLCSKISKRQFFEVCCPKSSHMLMSVLSFIRIEIGSDGG